MTVRRLMVYVAVIALVPQVVITVVIALAPRVEAAGGHWALCRQQAFQSDRLAAAYRAFASRDPEDAVIPGVTVRLTEKGPVIPATGKAAAKMASYFAVRARIYDRAKWCPWAGMPAEPPWPKL
jgi:hypothetical protein